MRPVLIVGGAPRLQVDAVRHMTVRATGTTALRLVALLIGLPVDLLLSADAAPDACAMRYTSRADLDLAIKGWVQAHPEGVIVMSAAVNDYEITAVERTVDDQTETIAPGAKIPSRADELVIRLGPAPKLIDQLASWGHTGPLVAFKFEDAATVVASAERLRTRVGAALVVANSLDGELQALVDEHGTAIYASRSDLVAELAERITGLAS